MHHHAILRALGDRPRHPADEPVDRVTVLGLGQWQLMLAAIELDSARPGFGWATG